MRATLADISGTTGYSKSTVSIALRNDPRVPATTRQAIQAVAQRLGYRPDPNLARIAAARWRQGARSAGVTLAFLFDSRTPAPGVLKAYLAAGREQAEALGYAFAPLDLRAYPNARALCRVLEQRGVRGALIAPVYHESLLAGFDWSKFAAVSCGLGLWRPPGHVVNTDVFAAAQMALRECVAAGYRRIGAALFLHPRCAEDDRRRRGAVFLETVSSANPCFEIQSLDSAPEDRAALLTWFEQVRPEVVVALHRGVARWLLEAGYRIPEDVALVCLGQSADVDLARVDAQSGQVAQIAIEMLDLALRQNEVGPPPCARVVLVPPIWRPGPSLAPRARVA